MSVPRSIQNDVQPEYPGSSTVSTTTTSSSDSQGLMYYVTAPWHEILKSIVPLGYQDETGFHFGDKAGTDEITA
jgi:hypothetical protein